MLPAHPGDSPQLNAVHYQFNEAGAGFVNPVVLRRCEEVLDRRGEDWAASVVGRDIARRSLMVKHRPYLLPGEDHTLVVADTEEDRLDIADLDFAVR